MPDLELLEKLKPGMKLQEIIPIAESLKITVSFKRRAGEIRFSIPGQASYLASYRSGSDAGKALVSKLKRFACILAEEKGNHNMPGADGRTAIDKVLDYIRKHPGISPSNLYVDLVKTGMPKGTVTGVVARLTNEHSPRIIRTPENKLYHCSYLETKDVCNPFDPEGSEFKVLEPLIRSLGEMSENFQLAILRLEDVAKSVEDLVKQNDDSIANNTEIVDAIELLNHALDKARIPR